MVIISTFAACLNTIRMVFSSGLRVAGGKTTREKKCVSTYDYDAVRARHALRALFLPRLSVTGTSNFAKVYPVHSLTHSHYTTTRATARYNVQISEENLCQLILHDFTILHIIRPTILLGVCFSFESVYVNTILPEEEVASSIKFYLRVF